MKLGCLGHRDEAGRGYHKEGMCGYSCDYRGTEGAIKRLIARRDLGTGTEPLVTSAFSVGENDQRKN